MGEQFKIYVDRLRKGEVENLSFIATPEFLGVDEADLRFIDPVDVTGEAYLAEAELVVSLQVKTVARIPCSVCNQLAAYPLEVEKFYFTIPYAEITSHIFDFSEQVREAVLLEVPFVVECNEGKCPARQEIAKFLASPHKSEDEGWQPFKDL